MFKQWLCLMIVCSGMMLGGCHARDEAINTSDELQEEDDKISASDFVEYNLLMGILEFGGDIMEITSNKEEVVIYDEGEGDVLAYVDYLLERYEEDGTTWDELLSNHQEMTKTIKIGLVNNDYPQDCVLRIIGSGHTFLEVVNGRVQIDEISESYAQKFAELSLAEGNNQTSIYDEEFELAKKGREIFNQLATGNLVDAIAMTQYDMKNGMYLTLNGSFIDYTDPDIFQLGTIAKAICEEFGDRHLSINFMDYMAFGEWNDGEFSIRSSDGEDLWYGRFE